MATPREQFSRFSDLSVEKTLYQLNDNFDSHWLALRKKKSFSESDSESEKKYFSYLKGLYDQMVATFENKLLETGLRLSEESQLLPHYQCQRIIEKLSEAKYQAVVLLDWDDTLFPTSVYENTPSDIDKNMMVASMQRLIRILMEKLSQYRVATVICTARTMKYSPIHCESVLDYSECCGGIYTANMVSKEYFRMMIKWALSSEQQELPVLLVDDQIMETQCLFDLHKNGVCFPVGNAGNTDYLFNQIKYSLKAHKIDLKKNRKPSMMRGGGHLFLSTVVAHSKQKSGQMPSIDEKTSENCSHKSAV